jgi:S-formylglutathione hydrolase FrmB
MNTQFLSRPFITAVFALVVLSFAGPALASDVVTREFASPALGRAWSYSVYLPTGYDTEDLDYPVVYLLHGNGGTLNDWVNQGGIRETADALIANGDIPPAVIVMPDAGTSWYVDRKENMKTAVIDNLIPDVESNFNVLTNRDGRFVAGLSMGGYGAMRFALKYPELFAAAGLLSPAIYDPEPPETSAARRVGVFGASDYDPLVWKELSHPSLWDAYLEKQMPVPMYINSGDDDQFLIELEVAEFYSLLRANGQPAELRIVDGGHTWSVWKRTIGDALTYMFTHGSGPAAR